VEENSEKGIQTAVVTTMAVNEKTELREFSRWEADPAGYNDSVVDTLNPIIVYLHLSPQKKQAKQSSQQPLICNSLLHSNTHFSTIPVQRYAEVSLPFTVFSSLCIHRP
jgi:hypothetical protein